MFDFASGLDAYKDYFDELAEIFQKLINYGKEAIDKWLTN